MNTTSVTLVTADDLVPTGNPLEDVTVRVYTEDGATFVTEGVTDEDGELVLELEDATTYWVRFFKIGYRFPSQLLVDVDSGASSNTFDVEAVDLTILPPATVPYLCRASGFVRGGDMAPKPGVKLTFMGTGKPRVVYGQVIVVQDVIVQSDEDGWVEVDLVRNGFYDVVVDGLDDTVERVAVPDRGSVSIVELIWPYVAALEYDAGESVGVDVGDDVVVTATTTLSSGVTTPFTMDNEKKATSTATFIRLTVTDPLVCTINLVDDTLTIHGKAAGTTTITAEVVPNKDVERLPEPTRDFTTLTVTVS